LHFNHTVVVQKKQGRSELEPIHDGLVTYANLHLMGNRVRVNALLVPDVDMHTPDTTTQATAECRTENHARVNVDTHKQ
jgi:hypothetical protein